MTAEGDTDSNALLRNLLESLASDENAQLAAGANAENVAQLLAAAIAQVGQSILFGQGNQSAVVSSGGPEGGVASTADAAAFATSTSSESYPASINPQTASSADIVFDLREAYESVPQASTLSVHEENVISTVEVPTSEKPRPLCIKFPIELRKRIISMRKEGKLSKDIAKELKVSVSGVQKVWERFLATGMAHDRKPSTYAGRPRKSTYSQEMYSPAFELQSSDDVFPSSQMEYVTTPTSATPTTGVQNSDVIITEESEVFTEGATVEIVETTPLAISQPKSPKKKGAPPYRGRLLLKLIEDCPLATMRASTDGLTNPHVQNLMISITRPLYMEYVLGHPFGKVPLPRPFDGCTSTEAEIILSDPSNPVGKNLLAALGYSTKVYFNACCKPSPLFDTDQLLSSLPVSLGPGHLADSMKNVIQLLIDLCTNPEEALNRLPTAAGPPLVARRGDTILTSHSIPAPSKLSEFWTQLYTHVNSLQCCENFVSAHPPSAPCLLCHPFEAFAQSLELIEPEEDIPLTPSPLPPSQLQSQFTPDPLPHASSEVEVQVLESGTSGLTSIPTVIPLPRRGRGKGRKQSKTTEKQPRLSYSIYEEQNVVSDGEFEIPALVEDQADGFLTSTASNSETLAQVEASEAAQNLALLATHITSMANIAPVTSSSQTDTPLGGVAVPLPSPVYNQSPTATVVPTAMSSSENVASEIVAVAEVVSGVWESRGTFASSTPSSLNEVESTGEGESSKTQSFGTGTEDVMSVEHEGVCELSGSVLEPVRRSRRRVTRVKRLVSEEPTAPSASEKQETLKKCSVRRKGGPCQEEGQKSSNVYSPVVLLEDILASPPMAKRTRSKAGSNRTVGDVGLGMASGGGCGHPSEWGVAEVGEFIGGIPQCAGLKEVFMEHLVDGETLLSLDPQMMVKLMELKTGPALRIHRKIASLKKDFNISD